MCAFWGPNSATAVRFRRCGYTPCLHTHCNTLQYTVTPCNTLRHTATPCNTLQHTATHTTCVFGALT